MNGKYANGGATAAILLIVFGIVLLFIAAGAFTKKTICTQTQQIAQRATKLLETATISDLGPDAEPEVVREAFRERRKRENSEWTPANIRKHPDLYLDHCETMLQALLEECRDALFAAKLESVRQERKIVSAREEMVAQRKFLLEAEAIAARATNAFPVKIGSYTYSASMFTNAVREADAVAARDEQAIPGHENGKMRADNLAAFLETTIADISTELDGLALDRETLRADNAQRAVKDVKKRIDALMDGVVVTRPVLPPVRRESPKTSGLEAIFKRNREKTPIQDGSR